MDDAVQTVTEMLSARFPSATPLGFAANAGVDSALVAVPVGGAERPQYAIVLEPLEAGVIRSSWKLVGLADDPTPVFEAPNLRGFLGVPIDPWTNADDLALADLGAEEIAAWCDFVQSHLEAHWNAVQLEVRTYWEPSKDYWLGLVERIVGVGRRRLEQICEVGKWPGEDPGYFGRAGPFTPIREDWALTLLGLSPVLPFLGDSRSTLLAFRKRYA